MTPTDLVYQVRPGDENDELRRSLRSLANLPHDTVWIAGHKPAWATNVGHIPTPQQSNKHTNALANILAALDHPDVSETFVLMNDDFFVTAPLDHVPALHRGPVAEVLAEQHRLLPEGSAYLTAMEQTADWLRRQGIPDPRCYDLHVPMTLDKTHLLEVLRRAGWDGVGLSRFHYRTAYGNLMGIGGDYSPDVKVYTYDKTPIPTPFASTNDKTYTRGWIGRHLRRRFSKPSPYECG